ncbi:MFS transporter [Paenibacillus macerans]|uniref:MFS transporter n=1 Tax=Paenibacillus macerans TaxID=44252 RepID=UPI00203C23E7|nr:MFS transporter [Paenibacillus macerans]MCM3700952.1 MFS transporter [Paenibacillus macerans]
MTEKLIFPPQAPMQHRNFVWVSLSCGLYWFAFSLTRPIISLYTASLGIQGITAGLVLAVYALLPLLAAIPGGFIADRLGRTVVLRAGAVLMMASGLLYGVSAGPWILAFAQLLAGLGQMAVWLAVQVLITEGPAEGSESRFATFSLYMAIGQMVAPIVSGLLSDQFGYRTVFTGYTLSSLLLMLTSWRCREESRTPDPAAVSPSPSGGVSVRFRQEETPISFKVLGLFRQCLTMVRNRRFAVILLTTFISLFIVDVRTAYLPIHLESLGISNTRVGLLISVGALSALFVRPIYPRLMDKLSFRWMLILTYGVSLLLLFAVPLLTNFYAIAALVFVTGLALGINQPMTLSMIAGATSQEERGLGIGLRLMSNRAAQLLDPLLFGFFTAFTSLRTSFLLVGVLLLVCCAFTVQLYLSSEKEPLSRARTIEKGREFQHHG